MRMPGYCESCHKPRPVKVTSAGMAMLATNHIATGICTQCEDRQDDDRKRATQERNARIVPGHRLITRRNPNGTWFASCSCGHGYRSAQTGQPVIYDRSKHRVALMHNDHVAEVMAVTE